MFFLWLLFHVVEAKRRAFVDSGSDGFGSESDDPHTIRRSHLYEDVLNLYRQHSAALLKQESVAMKYEGERAVHAGGVTRDVFSSFWDEAYLDRFDGGGVVVPVITPHDDDLVVYAVYGTILSHCFLTRGFLPVRIAFPVIACALKSIATSIPDSIVIESFLDFLSVYEANVLKQALSHRSSFHTKWLISLLHY